MLRRIRAPMSLGGDHDFSLEEGRGSRVRVSDVVMLSVMVCTLLLLLSLHDARLMIWYERPLSRARSLAESSETSPPPLPPPPPPPEYASLANLPRAVSFLSRNLEDNYMCEVGEVRASCHRRRITTHPPYHHMHQLHAALSPRSSSYREPLPGRAARATGREGGAPC